MLLCCMFWRPHAVKLFPHLATLSLALFTADRSQFVFVNFDLFAAFGIMGNCGLLPMQIDFAK